MCFRMTATDRIPTINEQALGCEAPYIRITSTYIRSVRSKYCLNFIISYATRLVKLALTLHNVFNCLFVYSNSARSKTTLRGFSRYTKYQKTQSFSQMGIQFRETTGVLCIVNLGLLIISLNVKRKCSCLKFNPAHIDGYVGLRVTIFFVGTSTYRKEFLGAIPTLAKISRREHLESLT